MFKKDGELADIVETTLRDVFSRLDKIHLGGSLGLEEFNVFLKKAVGEQKSSDFFKYNVLSNFAHNSDNELTLRGFLDWFKQWIQQ